ncbi:hypothetical protein L195_g036776 [Trifolium pratense]|uniref:Secreted protein n=1 Tax=Trifolium pratense TaxID=57577 RepID=A0A2K3LQE1_TRIPR|nr:hypothetical protein L195_g036776 [Trifolium pratense]
MTLTVGTKPRIVPKFYAPLVGAMLLTLVASATAASTSVCKDLGSYFRPSLRFYSVLTTRRTWSTSVLNHNTLPIMHNTELYGLSTR